MKKLDLCSMDIVKEQREKLRQLFPEVFTEDKIDFDKLRLTLGEMIETGKERYGMTWPGKADCFKIIQSPSIGTLKPCSEESVNFDTTENLFIEGDNLEVLKLLQKSYYGKIRMIYIDPPYNTGKEFIYPDDYKENLKTYLQYTGQIDAEGKKFSTNTDREGRFHSKWLNMMYPRLFLARNLLRDDGVIFISIDDNEVANLKKLCDEIYGEENFLGYIVRATGTTTGQDSRGLGSSFDYCLCYSKSVDFVLGGLPLSEEDKKRFKEKDEKGEYSTLQLRKTGNADRREDRPLMYYGIKAPNGEMVYPIGPTGYESRWRVGKATYQKLLKDNKIVWKEKKEEGKTQYFPYVKYYLEGREKRPSPLWNDIDGNKKASLELKELFNGKKVFDNPKPKALMQRMMQLVTDPDEGDIILDFFAGTSTTAYAVLDLNKHDGGNRKFICVQLPEKTDENSEAYKEGMKTIAAIGKETIRRVIKNIEKEKGETLFKDKKLDLGFKVFKLDKSNFKIWDGENMPKDKKSLERQLELHIDHIDPKATQEDILFEILLKAGFELTTKIEKIELAGKAVYSIEDGAMLVCLEKELTKDVIKAMAEKRPSRVICLDQGFINNDQLKTNAVQIMKTKGVDDFRTV